MVDSTIQSKDDSTIHVWVNLGIRFFSVYNLQIIQIIQIITNNLVNYNYNDFFIQYLYVYKNY